MSEVTKKESLLSFCNILRKSIVTVFVFYCDAKHSDTLQGPSHQSCLLLLVFTNIPTVSIFPGQPQFVVCCPSVPDWINLYWFLYFSPKNIHIYTVFHQQCKTIHLYWIIFIVILTLNAIKNITVLSSTKTFWKHSIRTFKYYFEKHIFDSITNSRKLVQKRSSEQPFFWKH